MIPKLSPREGQTSPRSPLKIKIKNQNCQNSINFSEDQIFDNHPFSFNQKHNQICDNTFANYNSKNSLQNQIKSNAQQWVERQNYEEPSIFFSELAKKLQNVSYNVLQIQYGQSFSQHSSYLSHISQLKCQESIQKLLHYHTFLLLTIIKTQQQKILQSKPKLKLINLPKTQRVKLKLILSQQEEREINNLKNKGLDTYVKKIQEESQRYKRENMRIKEHNRMLQNELLKVALEFKDKRELYITEITRLTQILHSSFLQVGKMFVNLPNQNNSIYPPDRLNTFKNKIPPTTNISKPPKQSPTIVPAPQIARKTVKSLSPIRKLQITNDYVKEQPQSPKFYKPSHKANSNERNYPSSLKPQSSKQSQQKNLQYLPAQMRSNRNYDVESQSAMLQKKKLEQRPTNLMLSEVNYPYQKNSFQ